MFRLIASALAVTALALPASAWGKTGHRIVGEKHDGRAQDIENFLRRHGASKCARRRIPAELDEAALHRGLVSDGEARPRVQ